MLAHAASYQGLLVFYVRLVLLLNRRQAEQGGNAAQTCRLVLIKGSRQGAGAWKAPYPDSYKTLTYPQAPAVKRR